jgi:hypothetical protein
MSIRYLLRKIKDMVLSLRYRWGLGEPLFIFIGIVSWGVALGCAGILVGLEGMRPKPAIIYGAFSAGAVATKGQGNSATTTTSTVQGAFLASKSGTKYYPAWCKSASRIKDANRVWFQSEEEAQKAGYTRAGTC